jgi:hypothetical protein
MAAYRDPCYGHYARFRTLHWHWVGETWWPVPSRQKVPTND